MGSEVEQRRAQLAKSSSAADRARLLVELAEHEPLLGHRLGPVRTAITAAGQALDAHPDPELEARVLLRLASLKLVETDYDAADAALTAVGDKVGGSGPLMAVAAVRAARVAIRRGPRERAAAAELIARGAAGIAAAANNSPAWQRALVETTLAMAEIAVHAEVRDREPFDALADLVASLQADEAWIDEVFIARQLLAVDALACDDPARAAALLRDVVKVAHAEHSPEDEIEARLARGAALATRGDEAGQQEAERVIQIARDRALEHGLEQLHVAALIAQAGLMSERGKTHGAIDRCLEVARLAARTGDARRYAAAVGVMAAIYQKQRDFASAYRTIAESYHALREATGQDVKPLFTPLLESLRDTIGAEHFERLVADVNRARQLADVIDERS